MRIDFVLISMIILAFSNTSMSPTFAATQKPCPAAENDLLRKAEQSEQLEIVEQYLTCFPTSDNAPRVRVRQKELREEVTWKEVRERDTLKGYQSYIMRYPGGRYFSDASAGIKRLKTFYGFDKWELIGDGVTYWNDLDQKKCFQKCRDNSACGGFTFLGARNECRQLDQVTGRRVNQRAFSGARSKNIQIEQVVQPTVLPSVQFRVEANKDYDNSAAPHADIARIDNVSQIQCEQICARRSDCQAYTHNTRARVCFLKSGVSRAILFPGAISGYKLSQSGQNGSTSREPARTGAPTTAPAPTTSRSRMQVFPNQDFANDSNPAADYSRYVQISLQQCLDICKGDDRCRAFTYNKRIGPTCILKTSYQRKKTHRDAISGVKIR